MKTHEEVIGMLHELRTFAMNDSRSREEIIEIMHQLNLLQNEALIWLTMAKIPPQSQVIEDLHS